MNLVVGFLGINNYKFGINFKNKFIRVDIWFFNICVLNDVEFFIKKRKKGCWIRFKI